MATALPGEPEKTTVSSSQAAAAETVQQSSAVGAISDSSLPTIEITASRRARRKGRRAKADRPRGSSPAWLIRGGVAAAAVIVTLAGVAFWLLRDRQAHLIVDWGAKELKGVGLTIDGERKNDPAKGAVRYDLAPGAHQIVLQRRGYDLIELELRFAAGEIHHYTPEWRRLIPTIPTEAPGFPGWKLSLDQAKEIAVRKDKDLLLAFGSSNDEGETQALCRDILTTEEFKALAKRRFARVVFDFPATSAPPDPQRVEQFRWHAIERIPTLVVSDSQGLPLSFYAGYDPRQRDVCMRWLEESQSLHHERDRLFEAVEKAAAEDRLSAAVAASQWLMQREIAWFYPDQLKQWTRLATQTDPSRKAANVEVVFAAHWLCRLHADVRDGFEHLPEIIADLGQEPYRFQDDPNLGFMTSVVATKWLDRPGQPTDMAEHVKWLFRVERAEVAQSFNTMLKAALACQPTDPQLREIHDWLSANVERSAIAGHGSGFVVAQGGYVLTNYHVVDGAGSVAISTGGDQRCPAEVIATDEVRDLALLRTELPDNTPAPLRVVSSRPDLGAPVAAFGFPDAFINQEVAFLEGHVNRVDKFRGFEFLRVSCNIDPGNSGGPLCNMHGEVVGIVTAKRLATTVQDSYGLVVPAEAIVEFLKKNLPNFEAVAGAGSDASGWSGVVDKVRPSVLAVVKLRP